MAPKPPTLQTSGTHMVDWDRIAARIADGLQRAGVLPAPGAAPATVAARPLHIHVAADGSTFLHGVRESLEGEILRRGGTVLRRSNGALVVNLDVEVVGWGARLPRSGGSLSVAGGLGAIGTLIGDTAPLSAGQAAATIAGAGVALDLIDAMTPRFGAEAAWRATIYDGDRLAFLMREPIYIHSADIPLYQGGGRSAHVPSEVSGAPLPVRTIRYAR